MSHRKTATIPLVALALAGCASAETANGPLGRSIAATPTPLAALAPTPAPLGDPPSERGGSIPATAREAEDTVSPAGVAGTAQSALQRYALAYINWRAGDLGARERQLVAISTGAAKLTAEQTLATRRTTTGLAADDVANSGQVVAIARGQGPDHGQWVIVTQEHTTGTGPYATLPAGPHVTLAQATHGPDGWVVSAWNPVS